jgi:glycosyltransferase involved in cell wall biosynthesis
MELGLNGNTENVTTNKGLVRPAIFVDTEDIREYSSVLRHLMVGLADRSNFAALVCPANSDHNSVLCPSVELIYHPLFKIPIFIKQNQQEVLDKLLKFKPTVLHCFSPSKAPITAFISEQLSLPYLLTFNSPGRLYSRSVASAKNCAGLITSSNAITEKVTQLYSKCSSHINQVNTGTFVEDRCACFSNSPAITSLVVAQDLKRIGQFESFLNAARHLAIDGYEFMLAIIGTGPASRKIRSMVKAMGLSNMVTVIAGIRPIRSVFEGADIFIQLDVDDGTNLQLLEAMSVGMAVASSKDNKSDLLIEDKTAVFFDPHDELSVYASLKKLLSTHEFARQLAIAAQQQILIHHSVSVMTSNLIDIYQNAQKRVKPAPAPTIEEPAENTTDADND